MYNKNSKCEASPLLALFVINQLLLLFERMVRGAGDARFDTSKWASSSKAEEEEDIEKVGDGLIEEEFEEDLDGEDEDLDEDDFSDDAPIADGPVVKPLSQAELKKFEARQKRKGIIYISRIPHGMTVAKVRHLLSGFGDVERIFLQDGREKERGQPIITGRAAKSAHFTEGWVEYSDKRVAKAVAQMLNAAPIGAASGGSGGGGKGGKRSGGRALRRWADEVWTMRYLSGFKWGMLSEQLANERAARASRVRAELSQSSFEQKDYLRKVERARVMREKAARKQARETKTAATADQTAPSQAAQTSSTQHEHTFRQRQAIERDVRQRKTEKRKADSDASRPYVSQPGSEKRFKDDSRSREALQSAMTKIF